MNQNKQAHIQHLQQTLPADRITVADDGKVSLGTHEFKDAEGNVLMSLDASEGIQGPYTLPYQWGIVQNENYPFFTFHLNEPTREVLRIETDGRIFWNGREVESDDDFRAAMMDLTTQMKAML